MSQAKSAEKVVQEIRRKTRRQFSAEEKIRIVLEGLRGEESIAALCRREGLNPNLSGGGVGDGTAESWRGSAYASPIVLGFDTAHAARLGYGDHAPWSHQSCTTRPGVSRSLGIKRRSRRARSMSYARRHSTNMCLGNRVRYRTTNVAYFESDRGFSVSQHRTAHRRGKEEGVRSAGSVDEACDSRQLKGPAEES